MILKGKTAVITGASGRLGSEIALALGQSGCYCVCQYNKNRQGCDRVVEQIKKLGRKALAVSTDLTIEEDIKELFEQAGKIGRPQILINCAAVFEKTPLEQANFQQAQKILNINLAASIIASKYFALSIKENLGTEDGPAGKIINIADVGGIRPWAGYVFYCSSKAALIGATKALAKELAPLICVNAVAPGVVTWPAEFDEAQKQRQLSFIPLKRIADPKEIAAAVIMLLENDYMTGQVLCIDGGRSI